MTYSAQVNDSAPSLYRLHIRSSGDHAEGVRFCKEKSVVGLGWGTWHGGHPPPKDWPHYLESASRIWSWRQFAPVRWLKEADKGSLVWWRDLRGMYFLSRLEGEWWYDASERAQALDLTNLRSVTTFEVGDESKAPGDVVRAFAGRGQAFRRVGGEGAAARYSELLFAQLAGEPVPAWRPSIDELLDRLLGPLDVQDLVAAYLQAEHRYIALPARQVDNTMAYEYILRDPSDGSRIAVQVKSGRAWIDAEALAPDEGLRWLIFSPQGRHARELPRHVKRIDRDEVVKFLLQRRNHLPPVCETWMKLIDG